MSIDHNILVLKDKLAAKGCKLVVVSKNQPLEKIQAAYNAGHRAFGENKVKELIYKREILPQDIEWHMIGHLQTNKVKYIAPFVSLIHSVDSLKLIIEINKQGRKINSLIPCLLQIGIATEKSKFGMRKADAIAVLATMANYPFVGIKGLMGMASFTDDEDQIRKEFDGLRQFYGALRSKEYSQNVTLNELSMGMSSDYPIALEMGSTMVRIGTAVFR